MPSFFLFQHADSPRYLASVRLVIVISILRFLVKSKYGRSGVLADEVIT